MFKNQPVKSIVFLFFLFLANFISFAQTSKSDSDLSDATMILEMNNKKYALSNFSYTSTFTPPLPDAVQKNNEIVYYLTFSVLNQFLSQELLDWALVTPFKNENASVKVYNATKTKVLREIKLEGASVGSFSNSEDANQSNGGAYATAMFSLNCKKLQIVNK